MIETIDALLNAFALDEQQSIHEYLNRMYTGVFPPESIAAHLANYVGAVSAEWPLAVIKQFLAPDASIQDIGCGFGSFVLLAREAGFEARGVELSPFEVDFARIRLARLRPQDSSHFVYQCGDAYAVLEQGGLFAKPSDALSLWNVAEHMPDFPHLIRLCKRAIKPGGWLFIVCPNYYAWRNEAHYQLPWRPEFVDFPEKATAYLRDQGRDSGFFENHIFQRTNREVLDTLAGEGFCLYDFSGQRMSPYHRLRWQAFFNNGRRKNLQDFWDLSIHSICVAARKK